MGKNKAVLYTFVMILTLRTDKPEAEIGLYDGQEEVVYETWEAHRALAETLHTKLDALLKSEQLTLQDVTGIIAYKGPGSFTGLRIGLSSANALAYALGVPISAGSGENWILDGIEALRGGAGTKVAMPEYGAPVHITQQKK